MAKRVLEETINKLIRPYLDKWYDKGITAGKEDDWMTDPLVVEEDVERIIEKYKVTKKEYEDYIGDVFVSFEEGWEGTDHFNVFYGNPMWKDAEEIMDKAIEETGIYPENEGEWVIDIWYDLEHIFWRGFHESFGTDSYIEKFFRQKLGL